MAPASLRCTICGVEVTLSEASPVIIAEVETFCAAHNTHSEGYGVEVDVEADQDEDQTA